MKTAKNRQMSKNNAPQHSRRDFLTLMGTASGAAGASGLIHPAALSAAQATRSDEVVLPPRLAEAPQGTPNIVLILLDDVGYEAPLAPLEARSKRRRSTG